MSITRRRSTVAVDGDTTRAIGSCRARVWRRIGRAALIVAAGTAGLASAGPMALRPLVDVTEAAGAAGQVSVAFVLDFGTGTTPVVGCVTVDAAANRYEALSAFLRLKNMAQPSYATSGLLCSINGIPSTGCGQVVNGGYVYWSYFTGGTGGWTYANSGASGGVTPGDVEGWRFQNPGQGNPHDPPPVPMPQYDSICVAGTASPSGNPVTNGTTTPSTHPSASSTPASTTDNTTTTTTTTTATYPSTPTTPTPTTLARQATSGTSSPAVSVPAAPVAALGIADHSAGASGPGSGPLIIGGLLIAALVIAALARWRKRPRTP